MGKTYRLIYLFQAEHPVFTQPGAPRVHIQHIVQGLQKKGHTVETVALSKGTVVSNNGLDSIDQVSKLSRYDGRIGASERTWFRIIEKGIRRIQSTFHLPYFALFDSYRTYQACCSYFPKNEGVPAFDLIHERYNLMAWGGALTCKRMGIPHVLELNGDPFIEHRARGIPIRGLWKKSVEWNYRYSLRNTHKIICVSHQHKDHLVRQWQIDPERIAVLPNAVDVEKFNFPGDAKALKEQMGIGDRPMAIFVGKFYPWHGTMNLVESLLLVTREIPNVCLYMVGEGPLLKETEQRVQELRLDDNVKFIGTVPNTEIPKWLHAADIAVMAYPAHLGASIDQDFWGSPIKLFEYMAAGKAIVASSAGQIGEVIHHGENGLLATPGDIREFASNMVLSLNNHELRARLGRCAREQAIMFHSWDGYIEHLEEIYASIVDHKKSPLG